MHCYERSRAFFLRVLELVVPKLVLEMAAANSASAFSYDEIEILREKF